jgi:hypothetical protein
MVQKKISSSSRKNIDMGDVAPDFNLDAKAEDKKTMPELYKNHN